MPHQCSTCRARAAGLPGARLTYEDFHGCNNPRCEIDDCECPVCCHSIKDLHDFCLDFRCVACEGPAPLFTTRELTLMPLTAVATIILFYPFLCLLT